MLIARYNIKKIIIIFFTLSVFFFALTKVRDTDAWTHLSFGKWIWEHAAIPREDPFITTGKPTSYNNWLFGLLFYTSYKLFSIPGVIILKAVIVSTAFLILFRDALKPYGNYFVTTLIMTVMVVLTRHRFVERPDIFLMVFLSFSIFSLNTYLFENKTKYLYFLPFLHILWANSHTSLPLMVIPFIAFIAGGLAQNMMKNRGVEFADAPTYHQIKIIMIVLVASMAASLISPYFIDQYTYGAKTLSSPWWKQQINELRSPTWDTVKIPYILTAVIVMSFVLNIKRISLIHLFLSIPFIWFSFTSLRFISLLCIVSGPILSRNVSSFLKAHSCDYLFEKKHFMIASLCCLFLYIPVTLNVIRDPLQKVPPIFGFGIDYSLLPEKALNYMDKKGITGKVFNIFEMGGYIEWRDFPKRIPYIDGRGFESDDLLEKTGIALRSPLVMDDLERRYGFESVLLKYPSAISEVEESLQSDTIDLSFPNPQWALVFWDDVSLLYLKRGGEYDSIIKEDEYKFVQPANGFASLAHKLSDEKIRPEIMNELKRNVRDTGSATAYTYLGFAYSETGLYREALGAYFRALETNGADFITLYNGIAYSYQRLWDLESSTEFYEKSLSLQKDANILYSAGMNYISMNHKEKGIRYLEDALKMNPNIVSIYPMLVSLYDNANMKEKMKTTLDRYEKAKIKSEGEDNFRKGLQAYLKGSFDTALDSFRKSIEINPSNPASYSNIGYIFYDRGNLEKSFTYQRKSLEIDQKFANAHYGLALIYMRRGDFAKEKEHLKEYLKSEPAGFYSRRAMEEIKSIDKYMSLLQKD